MVEKYILPAKQEHCLELLAKKFKRDKRDDLIKIIASECKINEAAYSVNHGYNEDTVIHTLTFFIDSDLFLDLCEDKHQIGNEITCAINKLHSVGGENFSAEIESRSESNPDWRDNYAVITKRTPKITVLDSELANIWGSEYKKSLRIFISHRDTQKNYATKIKDALVPYKISCFVAHQDIKVNAEWLKTIEKAMNTADVVLPLLTSDFNDSFWTNQEIGLAYGMHIPIIAIRAPRDPSGFISKWQGLQWRLSSSFPAKEFISEILSSTYISEKVKAKSVNALRMAIGDASIFEICNNIAETFKYWEKPSIDDAKRMAWNYNKNPNAKMSYVLSGFDCKGQEKASEDTLIKWLNKWHPNHFFVRQGNINYQEPSPRQIPDDDVIPF